MKEKVSKKFGELYGSGAILFASPGRINLIGEHTDYNGGFVFPGAVDKGIVAAVSYTHLDVYKRQGTANSTRPSEVLGTMIA